MVDKAASVYIKPGAGAVDGQLYLADTEQVTSEHTPLIEYTRQATSTLRGRVKVISDDSLPPTRGRTPVLPRDPNNPTPGEVAVVAGEDVAISEVGVIGAIGRDIHPEEQYQSGGPGYSTYGLVILAEHDEAPSIPEASIIAVPPNRLPELIFSSHGGGYALAVIGNESDLTSLDIVSGQFASAGSINAAAPLDHQHGVPSVPHMTDTSYGVGKAGINPASPHTRPVELDSGSAGTSNLYAHAKHAHNITRGTIMSAVESGIPPLDDNVIPTGPGGITLKTDSALWWAISGNSSHEHHPDYHLTLTQRENLNSEDITTRVTPYYPSSVNPYMQTERMYWVFEQVIPVHKSTYTTYNNPPPAGQHLSATDPMTLSFTSPGCSCPNSNPDDPAGLPYLPAAIKLKVHFSVEHGHVSKTNKVAGGNKHLAYRQPAFAILDALILPIYGYYWDSDDYYLPSLAVGQASPPPRSHGAVPNSYHKDPNDPTVVPYSSHWNGGFPIVRTNYWYDGRLIANISYSLRTMGRAPLFGHVGAFSTQDAPADDWDIDPPGTTSTQMNLLPKLRVPLVTSVVKSNPGLTAIPDINPCEVTIFPLVMDDTANATISLAAVFRFSRSYISWPARCMISGVCAYHYPRWWRP